MFANFIETKRIYEPKSITDGYRILVDRSWPKGFKNSNANIDIWKKELAPSTDTIRRFQSGRDSYAIFKEKYLKELEHNPLVLKFISDLLARLKTDNITLIYAANSSTHNHAVILADYLNGVLSSKLK